MKSGEPRSWTEDAFGWLAPLTRLTGGSYATLGLLALGLGLIAMILITLSGFGGPAKSDSGEQQKADPFAEARETLEHDADLGACRAALQQVNVALSNRPSDQRPTLDAKTLERLQKNLGLGDDDLSEVRADNYTVLDGWHLAGAFLFRDAVKHALEPEQIGADLLTIDLPLNKRPTPLERATAAFDWAVREVRLAPPTAVGLTPSQLVVRRASGTPLERALVFLDLLDQLNANSPKPYQVTNVNPGEKNVTVKDDAGKEWTVPVGDASIRVDGTADRTIGDLKQDMWLAVEGRAGKTTAIDAWTADPPPALLGCLVFCDGRAAPDKPWACGVVVYGRPEVYLFDPRLGLALPGEGGVGVATLSDVVRKPDLLKQLKIEGAPEYDVTPAQAAKAELHLVCSLSALAPRMQQLQDKVLPPMRVSLYHNLEREMRWLQGAAAKASGDPPAVKLWSQGPTLLRNFLPPDEGGTDPGSRFELAALRGFSDPRDQAVAPHMQRYLLFQLELTPWDVMPEAFQNQDRFPYNVGLGLRVRDSFQAPFRRIALEPQGRATCCCAATLTRRRAT